MSSENTGCSEVGRRNNFVIYILLSATLMPITEVNRGVPLQLRIWLDVRSIH